MHSQYNPTTFLSHSFEPIWCPEDVATRCAPSAFSRSRSKSPTDVVQSPSQASDYPTSPHASCVSRSPLARQQASPRDPSHFAAAYDAPVTLLNPVAYSSTASLFEAQRFSMSPELPENVPALCSASSRVKVLESFALPKSAFSSSPGVPIERSVSINPRPERRRSRRHRSYASRSPPSLFSVQPPLTQLELSAAACTPPTSTLIFQNEVRKSYLSRLCVRP